MQFDSVRKNANKTGRKMMFLLTRRHRQENERRHQLRVSHKYTAANNPLLPKTYDSSQPNSYITFLDMNNLYGTAMVEPLPESGFA
jgi:hypothetical protein